MRTAIASLVLLVLTAPVLAVDPELRKLVKDPDSFRRSYAARALAKEGSPEAAKLLLALFDDESPYVRDHAVIACRDLERPESVRVIATAARSRDKLLRVNVADALGRTHAPAAVEPLLALARDRSWRVSTAALDAFWPFKDATELNEKLPPITADRRPEVRAAAVEAVGRLRLPVARKIVTKALDDPDPGVRCVARMELRYVFPDTALARLGEAAGDPEWRVRAQAVDDALALRTAGAVEVLVALVGDPVLRVAASAQRALLALSGKEIGRDPDLWKAWWESARADWRTPKGKLSDRKVEAGSSVARFHGVEVTSGQVVFVLDISGSMADPMPGDGEGRTRWAVVREELERTLRALPKGTLANVIVFEERVRAAFDRPKALSPKTVAELMRFAEKQSAGNRGDLHAAMLTALGLEGVDTIFLLSDGAPSYGEIVDKGRVRAAIRRRNRTLKRVINTIGFGSTKKAERRFMEGVARDSGGTAVLR